jgi:hypothetical protein
MLTSSVRRTCAATQFILRLRLRGDAEERVYKIEPQLVRAGLGTNLPFAEAIAVDIELTFENDDAMWKWIVTDLHHILVKLDHVMSAEVHGAPSPAAGDLLDRQPIVSRGLTADRRLIVVFVDGQVLEFHHQWEAWNPQDLIRGLRDQLLAGGRFLVIRPALGDCVVLRKDDIMLIGCRHHDELAAADEPVLAGSTQRVD